MKSLYVYDEVIENSKPIVYFKLNDTYKGVKVDTTYLDQLNHICPSCLKKLNVLELNRIEEVKKLTSFFDSNSRTVYVYGYCNECEEKIEMDDTLERTINETAEQYVIHAVSKLVEVLDDK